jgi:hypothetical protein
MSDTPTHKSSLQVDKEIEDDFKANGFVRPAIIMPMMGGATFSSWVDNAFKQAQEDKDRFLGRLPPKPEKQPNPAISKFNHNWTKAMMNNTRELGPGDVKKK